METLRPLPSARDLRYAIFDHDGTLTTLRCGWEQIMEPVMVQAIVGPARSTLPPATLEEITCTIRDLIDRTTGVQTLVQMQTLIELVRSHGYVPADQILDAHGYKAIYKEQLDAMVLSRVAEVRSGRLPMHAILIPGAIEMLARLHGRGIVLHLCSGSDQPDIEADVRMLEIEKYFAGGVHGAVGDIRIEAKRIILDRILERIGGRGHEVITFGDGPVEIRETKQRGGIAIGIASDEEHPGRIHAGKRQRLMNAGSDVIVADLMDAELLEWLDEN